MQPESETSTLETTICMPVTEDWRTPVGEGETRIGGEEPVKWKEEKEAEAW